MVLPSSPADRGKPAHQSSELVCGGVSLAKSRLMDWQELVNVGVECLEHKFFKAL